MSASPLNAFPLNNQYISSINYKPPAGQQQQQAAANPQFVMVLDRSGSMRDSVRRIVTEILPIFFRTLGYEDSEEVHLLTFSDTDDYSLIPVSCLASMTSFDQGGTCMFPAVRRLADIFETFKARNVDALRILAVSDGLISDQDKTEAAAGELARFAKSFAISINSQAVRWEQPSADTRALCSLLQLNNVTSAQMLDTKVASRNEDTAEAWARLFLGDQLTSGTVLSSNEKIFLRNPWDEEATEKVRLQEGANTVWMTQMPSEGVKVNDTPVGVAEREKPNYEQLYELMREKYNYVVNQMKVHRVVSTRESIVTMHRIVTYFRRVEVEVPAPAGTGQFSKLLEDIANDRSVAFMSPEELKAYLEPRDVTAELKPKGMTAGSGSSEGAGRTSFQVATMTPEQLADILRNFCGGSLMVFLVQPANGGVFSASCPNRKTSDF